MRHSSLTPQLPPSWGRFFTKQLDRGSHSRVITEITEATQTRGGHHLFITQFFSKHSYPHPPSWMIMETPSFGAVSRFYEWMRGVLRLTVAAKFNLQHDVLESWLHALAFTRNLCAHHNRIWNRVFTIRPKIPRPYWGLWPVESQALLYIQCCMIHHMIRIVADESQWSGRLRELISQRPGVSLSSMGFPDDWETLPFWKP
jgi:abortive infection bacteriophage resistance protein